VSEDAAARWVARAWALLVASSALYFLADNEADNDLWGHLFSGRLILARGAVPRADDLSYTASGRPWIDHEWLTQAGFAALFDGMGPTALWLGKLAIALLTVWLVWVPVARRSRSAWARGPVMVVVLATLARGYAIRPQVVTYLGVAALLAVLDRLADATPRRSTAALIALTAIGFAAWANAHGGVVVGLGILALFTAVPGRAAQPAATRAAMLATALLAACCNPYGPSLFTYVLAEIHVPHPLTEWQPAQLGDPAHTPFFVLLGALIATVPFARTLRQRPWWAALVGIVAVMAWRQQRHIPLFALVAAAPLAEQVDAALVWLGSKTRFRLSAAATLAVAVVLCGFALMQISLLSDRLWRTNGRIVFVADEYPVGALRYLREHGVHGNLALPLDWGGYALWHGAPALKVSLDGRFATVYPPEVVADNFAFFRTDGGADSTRLLDAYDTTLALVPHGTPTALDRRPDWHPLYDDAVATLFAKTGERDTTTVEAAHGWLAFP
jgi:hypothetical protein